MEVVRERKKKKKSFERYFSNEVERRRANEEYATFSACLEDFSSSDSINDRWYMSPIKWWVVHGTSALMLQSIALKLLGQLCSSSCCERNWSTYSFIHKMKRNKLTPQRAEDLVFVHNNLCLMSRRSPNYNEGESKMWDIGGDDSMDIKNTGILENANLSLDEPELEAILFDLEGNVGL